jgi:hypothetical protein
MKEFMHPLRPMPRGHHELASDLATAIRARGNHLVFEDCVFGSAWYSKVHPGRPDVLTIEKTYREPRVCVYEVKYNVTDIRNELKTGKWERYLEMCHRFFFALSPRLIDWVDKIPKEAGVLIRKQPGWYMVRYSKHRGEPNLSNMVLMSLLMTRDRELHEMCERVREQCRW